MTTQALPKQILLCITLKQLHVSQIGAQFGKTITQVCEFVAAQDQQALNNRPSVCAFLNCTDAGVFDTSIGFLFSEQEFAQIKNDALVAAGLTTLEMPAGAYFHMQHVGSYEGLPSKWQQFVAQAGKENMCDPSYEMYTIAPNTVADPAQWVTDLYCKSCQ